MAGPLSVSWASSTWASSSISARVYRGVKRTLCRGFTFRLPVSIHCPISRVVCALLKPVILETSEFTIPWIWRKLRVAAVNQGEAPSDLAARLAAKGIDLVLLPAESGQRAVAVAELAALLEGSKRDASV